MDAAFDSISSDIKRSVEEVASLQAKGNSVVPELSYSAVRDGTVSAKDIEAIRARGCVIIRNVFSRKQAEDWNSELGDYLDTNDYLERAKEKAGLDDYFGDLKDAKPQIYGVYCCLLYTSPSPRDQRGSRMPSSA